MRTAGRPPGWRAHRRLAARRTDPVVPGWQTPGMTTWAQFENEASQFAAMVRARFEAAETHILATLRKDGSPRVSGTEVDFTASDLSFGSMVNAVKARDLQ